MSTPPRLFDTPGERTAGSAGRGRAEGRAVTGGAQEEGVKEEAEERGTINREVVAGFRGLGGIDTPFPSRAEEETVGFGLSCHRGICLRKTIILGGG